MFIHSRFVVVDDKEKHLTGIKKSLDILRLDCHSKLYTDETVGEWQKLPGMRILFLDQNLITGATFGTETKVAFAALADVIFKLVCPASGPYGLILWAEQPELDKLKASFFERFTGKDAQLLPIFFTSLKKGDYINTNTGEIVDAQKLQTDIQDRISQSPQLAALLSWEADVSAAMDAVLRSVVNLIPDADRASNNFGTELGKVLYRLSQAGAGIERATESPREAVNRVLVPILADRIIEHDPSSGNNFDWQTALVDPTGAGAPSVPAQASVNSAIHLSFARSEGSAPIKATDLGAVVDIPEKDVSEFLASQFGLTEAEFLAEIFKVNEDEWKDCRARLVQIGAPCDFAQPKPGPLLYLFGVEWPFTNSDGRKNDGVDPKRNLSVDTKRTPKDLEWLSPILQFEDGANPGRISIFKNMMVSIPRKDAEERLTPLYRFRDEIISQITHSYSRHISRTGIVTLPER